MTVETIVLNFVKVFFSPCLSRTHVLTACGRADYMTFVRNKAVTLITGM